VIPCYPDAREGSELAPDASVQYCTPERHRFSDGCAVQRLHKNRRRCVRERATSARSRCSQAPSLRSRSRGFVRDLNLASQQQLRDVTQTSHRRAEIGDGPGRPGKGGVAWDQYRRPLAPTEYSVPIEAVAVTDQRLKQFFGQDPQATPQSSFRVMTRPGLELAGKFSRSPPSGAPTRAHSDRLETAHLECPADLASSGPSSDVV